MESDTQRHEIESFEEFRCLKDNVNPNELQLRGWVFQGVDLTADTLENFQQYNMEGAVFLGCEFPEGVTVPNLVSRYEIN